MATKSTQRWMPTHKLTCSKPTENTYLFPTSESDGSTAQSASVALDPTTGAVRGLVGRVGGTSDTTFRNFNYATQGKRSPGSTIKPLVVYAPALASGWSINKDLPNKPIDYNGYTPNQLRWC